MVRMMGGIPKLKKIQQKLKKVTFGVDINLK